MIWEEIQKEKYPKVREIYKKRDQSTTFGERRMTQSEARSDGDVLSDSELDCFLVIEK